MQDSVTVVTGRPPSNRSGLTNDPRRLGVEVDGRSPEGRRFSDIYDQIAIEFPGADPSRIREITVLKFERRQALAV